MNKPELSWQGIGISSNPNQKKDPLSVHLLAYLMESSDYSDRHVIVVPDSPQVFNYIALNGLSKSKAERIANRKGKRRKKDLERICKANGLSNIDVVRWNETRAGHEELFEQVHSLYKRKFEVRDAVLSTVPDRLKQRTSEVDTLAGYALEEIAAILSFSGVKLGHEGERKYDELATKIHDEFGIGTRPQFHYDSKGLEYVPQTGRKVEPYSDFVAPSRMLLTDSKRNFLKKFASLPAKSYRKLVKNLKETWGESPEENERRFMIIDSIV